MGLHCQARCDYQPWTMLEAKLWGSKQDLVQTTSFIKNQIHQTGYLRTILERQRIRKLRLSKQYSRSIFNCSVIFYLLVQSETQASDIVFAPVQVIGSKSLAPVHTLFPFFRSNRRTITIHNNGI